jgi:hypothetical protein
VATRLVAWTFALLAAGSAHGESQRDVLALLADPLGDLTRVDAELDADYKLGSEQTGSRQTLTLRPRLPIHLSARWNLVTDASVPLVAQEDIEDGAGAEQGLGDIEQQTFLTPARSGTGITWGAGAVVRLGTALDAAVGTASWGAGPALILVQREERMISGLIASQIWGEDGADNTRLQGFTTWVGPRHSVNLQLEALYDGRTGVTKLPVTVAFARLIRTGTTHINMTAGARYYVDAPDNLGPWGLHLGFTWANAR